MQSIQCAWRLSRCLYTIIHYVSTKMFCCLKWLVSHFWTCHQMVIIIFIKSHLSSHFWASSHHGYNTKVCFIQKVKHQLIINMRGRYLTIQSKLLVLCDLGRWCLCGNVCSGCKRDVWEYTLPINCVESRYQCDNCAASKLNWRKSMLISIEVHWQFIKDFLWPSDKLSSTTTFAQSWLAWISPSPGLLIFPMARKAKCHISFHRIQLWAVAACRLPS